MKLKTIAISALLLALSTPFKAQDFSHTLRLDYIFSGTDHTQEIALSEMRSEGEWAGRRVNMDKLCLKGNGQITMRDSESGKLLYTNSFSTLFQEWQNSEEAVSVRKAFENVFLLPMPDKKAEITVELFGNKGESKAKLSHNVDPADILIRPAAEKVPYKYVLKSGSPAEKIDIAIIGEGYTESEADTFYEDANAATESIFSYEPFRSNKDKFNVVAVAAPSKESGVSIPHDHTWKSTALGSHFDTFYSDRYLTTLHLAKLHDLLSGVPYEHIVILANTDNYGGGGIFNSYLLTAAHNKWAAPVVVHEFGHSFGGLADEYYYDDQYTEFYYPDVEPWEPNITTKVDFGSKWEDMMGQKGVGLFEGGGYMSKGVWRPAEDCRMKTNQNPDFCPVCRRALQNIIDFYTVEQ